MGARGGSNGDWSHEGQSDGLSGLPPEWGTIVVPDDASELAVEAEEIRRELRHDSRRRRWRRRFGLAAGADSDEPSIGLPLLIMGIAVVATLTSLFAVAWPRAAHAPVAASTPVRPATELPDVTLTDYQAAPVRLRDATPAVIVFIDGCTCQQFVRDLATATEPGITIFPIGRDVLRIDGGDLPTAVHYLTDPEAALRTRLVPTPPAGSAAVALVSGSGLLVRVLPEAHRVDEFRTELGALI